MKLTLVAALLVLLLPGLAGAQDLQALAARVKPAVVHITVHDAAGQLKMTGTGFFITEGGWIVTSDHVIEKASQVRIVLADGSEREVLGALARDFDRDVAIIKAAGTGYPALDLDDSGAIPVGATVAVMGGPLGLTFSLTSGHVSAYLEEGLPERLRVRDGRRGGSLLQIDAALSPGSSGSPVLNAETGKVVGVAASIITGARGLNFAVPVEAVHDLMLTIGPDAEPSSFSQLPLRNAIISAVFFAVLGVGYVVFKRLRAAKRRRRTN